MEALISDEKQRLRESFKQKRKALSAAEKRERDRKIFSILQDCEAFKRAKTLLIYCSTPLEPDTGKIIGLSLRLKKHVAVPRTKGKGRMDFVFINSLSDLREGRYGILEPADSLCEVFSVREEKGKGRQKENQGQERQRERQQEQNDTLSAADITDTDGCSNTDVLCIVPGLCFDKNGSRIGYGGGYYDRFLKDFCGVVMGLCYDECFLESIPRDEHDISVDLILTETGLKKADGRQKYGRKQKSERCF